MAWSQDDKSRLRTMWLSGRSSGEISRDLGRFSRNAVMGMVNRLGLMGRRDAPVEADAHPPAIDAGSVIEDDTSRTAVVSETPRKNPALAPSPALDLVEEIFGQRYDPASPGHLTALVAIAAITTERSAAAVARATGMDRRAATMALGLLEDAGVWRPGDLPPRQWVDRRSGNVAFILDVLVAEGVMSRVYDDDHGVWLYEGSASG